jgi:hypothetical protein
VTDQGPDRQSQLFRFNASDPRPLRARRVVQITRAASATVRSFPWVTGLEEPPIQPFMSLHRQVLVGHDRLSHTRKRWFPPVGQSHTEPRSDASNRVGPQILKRHHVLRRQLLSAALNRHLIMVAPVTHHPPCIFPRRLGASEKRKSRRSPIGTGVASLRGIISGVICLRSRFVARHPPN